MSQKFPYEIYGIERPNTIAKMFEEKTQNQQLKSVKFKVAEIDSLIKQVTVGTISFSRFVEIINERI